MTDGGAAETAAVQTVRDEAVAAPSLMRDSAVVAMGTALSRVTGFVRLVATAGALGFERVTDTYTLANTTPNIIYELLLGGVLSATLVPIFVQHAEEGDDDGSSAVVSVAGVLLVAAMVVGFFAAPTIVRLYTLSVDGEVAGDQQEVASSLLRMFMPQMLFYGLTAMGTALLNARRRFAAPAFAPVLNNLLVTGVLLAMPLLNGGRTPTLEDVRSSPALLFTLGLGTTAGIVAMTLALVRPLRQAGVRLRFNLDWHHRSVRRVGRMSGWTLGYVLCNQVALLVVLVLANRDEGGVSAYTAAFIFFLLPHALFAVSIMTTLVPELAAAAVRGDNRGFRYRFSRGIRLMALVVLPASTGYVVLAHPIVTALLDRGALTASSSALTADVLASFGAGLFGFSVYLYTLRGFYALSDTRTPFLLNVLQNVLQIGLAFVLVFVADLGVPGLALAYGGAYTLAGVVALVVLRGRVGSLDGRRVARSIAKIVAACLAMGAAVSLLGSQVGGETGTGALVRCMAGVVLGGAVYGVAVLALRVEEVGVLRDRLLRRGAPRA